MRRSNESTDTKYIYPANCEEATGPNQISGEISKFAELWGTYSDLSMIGESVTVAEISSFIMVHLLQIVVLLLIIVIVIQLAQVHQWQH